MAGVKDNGNRTRPCTMIYRTIMAEFERQRLARGLSMAEVDDLAGTQDGYYAKMLYPDTPNGRQARWETVQDVGDALFGRGFTVAIQATEIRMLAAPSIDKGASSNALKIRHWRHSKHFQELGRKGGTARLAKLSPKQHTALAKRMARKRWGKSKKAKRQGAAHATANAAAKQEDARC